MVAVSSWSVQVLRSSSEEKTILAAVVHPGSGGGMVVGVGALDAESGSGGGCVTGSGSGGGCVTGAEVCCLGSKKVIALAYASAGAFRRA